MSLPRAELTTRPTAAWPYPRLRLSSAQRWLSSAVLCSGLQRACEMMGRMERHVDLLEERAASLLLRDVWWNAQDMLEDLLQGGEPRAHA